MRKPEVGSFDHCKRFVMGVVRGNRFLAEKHNWNRSEEWAANYVENQNAARCEAHHWDNFLILESEPLPLPPRDIPAGDDVKKNLLGSVVGAGKQLAAGVHILLDWLGSGGKPVEPATATARALICSTCPQNKGGDWKAIFTKPVAEKIRQQLEMKNEMSLSTPHDAKLTVCEACSCPLQLKVWTPLPYILAHTDAKTRAALDPRCWITHEEQAPN